MLPQYDIFDAKGYTLSEQAQLFHEANIVIGPFGASLTNTMFCKPGTFILEFRHKLTDSNNALKSRLNNTIKSYFHLVEVLTVHK